jgi:hypothetical protein
MFPEVNSYEDLISCPDDEDWYELDLRGVQIDNLQFSITFSHAGGDLDMFLQDDDGRTPCARPSNCTSDSEDDNESIETGALPPGIYYLNVEGFDDDANDYDMDITVTPYICDDDLLSGNQSRDDAVSANLADDSWSREDLTICKGDSDWFAVDVDAGDDLKVALDFLAVQGDDLSLKIYEPGSNQAVVNVISANPPRVQGLLALQNSECVKVDDAGGGIYMIEVYGTGRESSYDIDIDSAAGLGDCPAPD